MKFCRTDAQSILSQIKRQEKQIKLKRRWMLGIPLSKSERKKLNKSKFFQNLFLSESLLREDDLFYESVRTHVEGAFGAPRIETENDLSQDDDMHLIHMPDVKLKRLTLSCLDNLTTKGLYLLAMIVTSGSVKSEKTRCNLKKIIKGSLSSVLGGKSHSNHQLECRKQIFQLLTNPRYFRDRCEPLSALRSQSYHAAVAKVLHSLQDLPSQTLIAMRSKLKGGKSRTPQLQPRKHGWGRDHLIKLVTKISGQMLLQLDGGNELQEPLAKAMAVAELSLKLTTGCHNVFAKEFYQFSPEVKSLQNDIINAIWSVKKVVTVPVLRNLQLLIEPKAVISNRCLRTAFVNCLTEFLFECSDMDCIPKSLSQILDVINRNSNSTHNVVFHKKYIEEEVDCILSVSAQAKQIVLDLLPHHEFDQDFSDAYVEELEESDDSDSDEDDDDDDNTQFQEDGKFINTTSNSMDSNYEAESIGDFAPPPTSMSEENVSFCPQATSGRLNNASPDTQYNENAANRHDSYETDTEINLRDASHLFSQETGPKPTNPNICKNQYLAIQDACDKTSMLAYNLVGHLLGEFARIESLDLNLSKSVYLGSDNLIDDVEETEEQSSSGDERCSAVVRVVKELIPSFPDSAMERLKMLMS